MGAATLSVDQMPTHTHDTTNSGQLVTGGEGLTANISIGGGHYINNQNIESSGGSQSHTHGLSGATGVGNGLPPYYSLALIIRVS